MRKENQREIWKKASKKYYEKNKKQIIEKKKEYSKTRYLEKKEEIYNNIQKWKKENPEKNNGYGKKYRDNNKQKIKARYKANYNIKLKSCCEICKSPDNLEKHHWRYDKPLLVSTLCKPCHSIQHGGSGAKIFVWKS